MQQPAGFLSYSRWLLWAFLFGLILPYFALLLHFGLSISDWTPFDFNTGKAIVWAVPADLIIIFLALMLRSALRQSTTAKLTTGLLVFLCGIGCIGFGIFTALKFGLLPGGAPSFV
jgi:hypothetical protein